MLSQTSKGLQGSNKYVIKGRKFEVNTLCRVFLGKGGLHMFTLFISLYCYCTLWAYTSVFCSAMAHKFPIFSSAAPSGWASISQFMRDDYSCYAIAFALVVVPLSCLELDEQIAVQVTMTGCRFLMLFFMLFTSTQCASDNESAEKIASLNDTDEPGGRDALAVPAQLFQFSGLHKMLPILVFALIFHHSIPGLSHPVRDKKQLRPIFQTSLAFSTFAYVALGLVLGWTFGTGIKQSANLNWGYYRGGKGAWDDETQQFVGVPKWAEFISLYVVCFPALDVLSAYPLNSITLGNNLLGAFFGRRIHDFEVSTNSGREGYVFRPTAHQTV